MLGYDDKRNFYRMMVNSPCEVSVINNPSAAPIAAVCKDISATGMSLEIDQASIDLGTLLDITIDSNNEQIPSLEAKAKVVRCDSEAENSCLVGVEITEMK